MNVISTFKKFSAEYQENRIRETNNRTSNKLKKTTEEFHSAQLKLQQLQKEFIGIEKENKIKREELKKAIIAKSAIVKQKEDQFNKALGDEDIEDFEI